MTPSEARDRIWEASNGANHRKAPSGWDPSLDLLAALWAEYAKGWTWQKNDIWWSAFEPVSPWSKSGVQIRVTESEVEDRTVLLALVMEASK